MKARSIFFLITFLSLMTASNISLADSPLTSTPFWQAYEDEKHVKHAKENGLDKKSLKWLTSSKITCDIKLAMINSFGWESGYTSAFEDHLLDTRKGLKKQVFKDLKKTDNSVPEETTQTKLLTTDDMVCWAYLRAMDNYQTPQYSMRGAFIAYWRDKKNMAAGVVWALLVGQQSMLGDWCTIYEAAETFIVNGDYDKNVFREEATVIMMEYLNLYEQDCDE